jgi:uncharacterized membrane protein
MSIPKPEQPHLIRGAGCVVLGSVSVAFSLQTALQSELTAITMMSPMLWRKLVTSWGGTFSQTGDVATVSQLSFTPILIAVLVVAFFCWLAGAAVVTACRRTPFVQALSQWGCLGWLWWLVPGVWLLLWSIAFAGRLATVEGLLLATLPFWFSLMVAGWLAVLGLLLSKQAEPPRPGAASAGGSPPAILWFGILLYTIVFTAMNWQLYRGLLVPHGDSAMYEEHLWNLTHGKGFRSYLDQGLFLGEHIQVIHLLLVPLHLLWPSHLMLELCESLALASGAIPVYWIARRHTGCSRRAALPAIAYLLYFPMQFLDISVDLKTFRPISFGVPLFLFAIDRLECGRYRSMSVLLLLALAAKEDYALVIAPLGVWLAATAYLQQRRKRQTVASQPATGRSLEHPEKLSSERAAARLSGDESTSQVTGSSVPAPFRAERGAYWIGLAMAGCGIAYLALVTRVVIPWFRGGEEVHYARYFSRFGSTLDEIAWNILTRPELLFGELVSPDTLLYVLAVLLPIGFLPLLSPGRLAVGLPLLGLLCLNEIARDPRHHFHAPLIPVLFWSAAAALAHVEPLWKRIRAARRSGRPRAKPHAQAAASIWASHFIWTSALAAGLLFSIGPLGRQFWDPGVRYYWRALYVPGKRAEMFALILPSIPHDSRVASTDHIHPRFTHHVRAYDYSHVARKVNDDKPGAPPDTDYIVIDTQHYYVEIETPEQIPEYRDHPDQWELLPDPTEGHFIVLRRKHPPPQE